MNAESEKSKREGGQGRGEVKVTRGKGGEGREKGVRDGKREGGTEKR